MVAYCTTAEYYERFGFTTNRRRDNNDLETVDSSGTLGSGSVIFLDKVNVITGTQIISYGESSSSVTLLTETTHYTIDLDLGEITITTAGATAIGSNSVFANYNYCSDQGTMFRDSLISGIIDKGQVWIDDRLEQTFNGVTLIDAEDQIGKGPFKRLYRVKKLQPVVIKTQLNGSLTSSATSVTVDSTTGMTANEFLTIEGEVISIDSIDSGTTLTITRGVKGTVGTAHVDNIKLINYVIEISNTPVGSVPTFIVLNYLSNFDIDSDTGGVQLLHIDGNDANQITNGSFPLQSIFNRLRLSYKYGSATVPEDIKDLCLYITARKTYVNQVGNSLSRGTDGFSSEGISIINKEIDRILSERELILISIK